jgi:hypothetical protein
MDVLAAHWDDSVSVWMLVRRTVLTWKSFNAIAFYLDIADMLAKEGL